MANSQTFIKSTVGGVEVPSVAIGESPCVMMMMMVKSCERRPETAAGTWSWGEKKWGYKPEMLPDIKSAWHACNQAGMTFYDTA